MVALFPSRCTRFSITLLQNESICDFKKESWLNSPQILKLTQFTMDEIRTVINRLNQALSDVVVGQSTLIHQFLIGLLANGHIILEGGTRNG